MKKYTNKILAITAVLMALCIIVSVVCGFQYLKNHSNYQSLIGGKMDSQTEYLQNTNDLEPVEEILEDDSPVEKSDSVVVL